MEEKVISKGYTITAVSWENDRDNYATKSMVVESYDKAKAIYKMCKTLFTSSNSRNEGIGNINEGNENIAEEKIISYMKENPDLYPEFNDRFELPEDSKLISICMNINYSLLGSCEWYYSRVCESVKVTYSDKDLFSVIVDFDDMEIGESKVVIDGRSFICKYNDKGELVVKLVNKLDLKFFKTWMGSKKSVTLKRDYVKDVPIYKNYERGILRNCFPSLNLNEDEVLLNYDFYNDKVVDC